MAGKRSHYDLLAEVILAAKNGGTKTSISYEAKMCFRLSNKYFNLALEQGFITINGVKADTSVSVYNATQKGMEFLEAYKKLRYIE